MGGCASRVDDAGLLPEAAVVDDDVYYWRTLPSAELLGAYFWLDGAALSAAARRKSGVPKRESDLMFHRSIASRDKRVDLYLTARASAGQLRAHATVLFVRFHVYATQVALLLVAASGSYALLLRLLFEQRLSTPFAMGLMLAAPALCYCTLLGGASSCSVPFYAFHNSACVHAMRGSRLRVAGLRSLGSAVKHARKMAAIWSPGMFTRLIPILELALCTKYRHLRARKATEQGADRWLRAPTALVIVPRWAAPTLLLTLLLHTAAMALAYLQVPYEDDAGWLAHAAYRTQGMATARRLRAGPTAAHWWALASVVPLLGLCAALRLRARERAKAEADLAAFALAGEGLTHPADMPALLDLVRAHWVDEARFEVFVREDLLRTVRRALGPAWLVPWHWALFVSMPAWWVGLIDASTQPYNTALHQTRADVPCFALTTILFHLAIGVVAMPLALGFAGMCAWATRGLPYALGLALDATILYTAAYGGLLLCALWPVRLLATCTGGDP
ncbi:hypothetical protein T492DRAFT_916064, partial [Pavlovales sp. CCMP2436]